MSTLQSFLLLFFTLTIVDILVAIDNKLQKRYFAYVGIVGTVISLVLGIMKSDIELIIISCFGLLASITYGILSTKKDIIK